MKRLIPKSVIDQAKKDLRDQFISRIVKNINHKNCWHLRSIEKQKVVDYICHFSDKGRKKIFFKAKRFAFELFKGDLAENFVVYSNCEDRFCINPDHHFSARIEDHLKKLEKEGILKRRSGFKHSPETLAKMSKSQLGKKPNKQARLKMRLAKLGVKRDPELVARVAQQYFQGEKNACSKLTEKQVRKIRRLKKFSTSRELAKIFPVSHSHIRSIWRRSYWKHL